MSTEEPFSIRKATRKYWQHRKATKEAQERCVVCGRPGSLDLMGCCSAHCDDLLTAGFIAHGHTHGPCDPPEDCPVCDRAQTALE